MKTRLNISKTVNRKLLKGLFDNADNGRYTIGFKYSYNDDFKVTYMNGYLLSNESTYTYKNKQTFE